MEWIIGLKEWLMVLGKKHNVDPIVFGSIYVGAIPFFFFSVGWLVRNLQQTKLIVLPVLFTGFFFVSAYLYLIIAGRNIPLWVYLFIGAMAVYGLYSTVKKVKAAVKVTRSGKING